MLHRRFYKYRACTQEKPEQSIIFITEPAQYHKADLLICDSSLAAGQELPKLLTRVRSPAIASVLWTRKLNACALRIIAENTSGVLRDIATVIAGHGANVLMINQEIFETGPYAGMGELYIEYVPGPEREKLIHDLDAIPSVKDVKSFQPFGDIFGSRVIIIGGGAQVAQVALGAVNEADRHNIRGERISVDTIPLVGERTLALAVDAVIALAPGVHPCPCRLDHGMATSQRQSTGSGEAGIPVIALKMAGTVPQHADLVVTDPIQAGVFAVMHVSSKAVFDISRVRGREF